MNEQGPICCVDGIRGYGNPEHGIMIVGQFPNFNEMKTGYPFTGNDGELLNSVLQSVGWSRDKVYCTNSCCVRDLSRISMCYPRLRQEIEIYRPKLIVTLGAVACENMFHMKISKCRGALLYTDWILPGSRGLATWLPSAILQADTPDQQNDYAAELVRDLKKIYRYFRPSVQAPQRVLEPAIVIHDVNRAQSILDGLPRDELVVLDIETPMIDKDAKEADPYSQILCVGIGLENDIQYVFPEEIVPQLTWPTDVQWGGWNIYGFDMVALRDKYGINLPIVHDGMLTSYVRDERTKYGTHKLKHNSREDAGADFYEDEEIRDNLSNLYKYNGLDVAYNHRLLKYHTKYFDEDDSKLYYDLLIPAANMYSESQYFGCKIDVEKWFELIIKFKTKERQLWAELIEEASNYGYPDRINPNSDAQVGHFFFGILGIPTTVSHLTKGGKWSVDKHVLDNINHPWAAKLRLHRQVSDTISRYLEGPQAQIKHDGRVHPKVWIPGAASGRPSYSDPPVQQLPHRRTIGEFAEVRAIFVCDSDDYELIELDYAQIELWMLFAFSGDEQLHADLTEPWEFSGKADFHSRTCTWGVPCLEHITSKSSTCPVCIKWEFDRDNAKHVNFGVVYGETAHGLMRPPPIGTGLPLKECQELILAWYRRYGDAFRWQKSIEYILKTTGFIKTPFGRKRQFPIIANPKQIRQAVNAPIQGTASDYTLSSAVEMYKELRKMDSRILWTTHDSILLNVNKKYSKEVEEYATYTMQKPRTEGFPAVKVDSKHGRSVWDVSP